MRVLLIDDDKLVCISLKTILETEEDIEVVGCGFSGNDAIELYDKLNPDILLNLSISLIKIYLAITDAAATLIHLLSPFV